ncbi:MAG: PEP-CTERM sorting domain-containing protein [Verrucomicrobiales bacterium]|nr:PEP-CTERM sorting domain-containing protein [Verrucomicrobiales bacterium]
MRKFHELLLVGLLGSPFAADAQLTYNFGGINAAIPDGDPTGLVNVQEISDAPGMNITDLDVTLNISGTGLGGFNGDLYATLQHDSGYSVLLNRAGARTGVGYGYGDSGLGVTFDDAATGDMHVYRQVLNGSHTTPLGGSLTGTWKPDARTVDPNGVLESSSQTATLASFNSVPVNGTWTLFVADLSSGATHQLDSWGMQIAAVPEPHAYGIVAGISLFGLALWRRKHRIARISPTKLSEPFSK